ncbi:MAG: prolyl aminopeptidase [Methyloprofundus sp.]|nr:prolyl aminopeptidase [Methyloprofundus sp.]
MKSFYPEIEPFNTFFLNTRSDHKVYVEQSGNPKGIPVVFLHGGPCSGTRPWHRSFFDPKIYHIILFDQRGSGLSLPYGELEDNTTQDLIIDLERIRLYLSIKKWLVFSGSWGSTLGLLYAQKYTSAVAGLIIRGVFLARQKDLDWFIREGVNRIYPVEYQELLDSLPEPNIDLLFTALWGDDEVSVRRVTRAWRQWNTRVGTGSHYKPRGQVEHITQKMVEHAKMELHYARNHYFITENQVLENCECLQDIPTIIIHGRYDFVCPLEAAISLSEALPKAEFHILEKSGHIAQGDEMIHFLVDACDKMAERL